MYMQTLKSKQKWGLRKGVQLSETSHMVWGVGGPFCAAVTVIVNSFIFFSTAFCLEGGALP